jgi:transposase
MKKTRVWNPDQSYLLPPSPREWLPEDHLVYFILDVISQLDLSSLMRAMDAKDDRGERPYAPAMMLALFVYGYCVGVFSSRRIAKATYEDIGFRVIAGECHPHFTRISAFRRNNLSAFKDLFLQILKLCQKAGLVKLGHVAIDGTKLQGNASKHKAMSYERMQKEEKRLKDEIDELIRRAEEIDTEEDACYGVGNTGEEIPEELRRRESRLDKIRQAQAELEQEAKHTRIRDLEKLAEANEELARKNPDSNDGKSAKTRATTQRTEAQKLSEQLNDEDNDPDKSDPYITPEGLETHHVPCTADGKPTPKAQMNFTDADSCIMESQGTYLQGYNCQLAVDEEYQIIVAQALTNQPPDNNHLMPLLQQTNDNCGSSPETATADAGYWKPTHESDCDKMGIDVYVAQKRKKHQEKPGDEADTKSSDEERQSMARKLTSEKGKLIYARRKAVVEPVNGQIKEVRGFRRFHLRGFTQVRGEWDLVTACHNLLKLYRYHPSLIPA